MERRKLILDMDGDADNLLALAYALRSPEVEVLGVVTGHGFYQPETAAEKNIRYVRVREDKVDYLADQIIKGIRGDL